jgi:dihydrolipoamide dehydrogenase
LNVGCIPSKALLHSTELIHQAQHAEDHGLTLGSAKVDVTRLLKRKDAVVDRLRNGVEMLLKKRNISIYNGIGAFAGAGRVEVTDTTGTRVLETANVVIATGSVPTTLPFMEPDGKQIVTSNEAIAFDKIPKSLLVVGAGAIGLELGSVWSRLGSQVTFIEFLPTIAAGSDSDVSRAAERIFTAQGMGFHTSTRVISCKKNKSGVVLTAKQGDEEISFKAEKVLLGVGRKPNTKGLNLEKVGLTTDQQGRVPVNGLQTAVPGIWAIGDIIEGPMLAHKAEEDAVAVANAIAGKSAHLDYDLIPNVIYTHPEIASVGITEKIAREKGLPVKVGKFPLAANGRAIAQDATDGFCKIIADADTDQILGAAIIAPGASEMIANVVAHMTYNGSAEDLGMTVHAHPTISESVKEAAMAVNEMAVHSV